MNPTPPKELAQKTAKRLSLPEEYVWDLVMFYYTDLRTRMARYHAVKYMIPGLGVIAIRPDQFRARQRLLEEQLDWFQQRRDGQAMMVRLELESRKKGMAELEPLVTKISERKKQRINDKKILKSLEKQAQDPGRVVELVVPEVLDEKRCS